MTSTQTIKFIDFWLLIAKELDHARLLLNSSASSLDEFIRDQSDICSYLHRAIKSSFKVSQCQNLNSPISLEAVLDILGETAYTLQKEGSCDLFDIELLEEIAWLIGDRYTAQVAELVADHSDQSIKRSSQGAAIVSFPNYKIRRANAQL